MPLKQFGFEHQRALPTLSQEVALKSAPKQRLMMSWWEREVHIWRLSKSVPGQDDYELAVKGRKLVAKIFIKGEANITSAALSTDGSLLSVATAEDVKVFHLRSRSSEEGDGLKVSKVAVPSSFSTGARLLQFSHDGKWLSIIRSDSQIVLARISPPSSSSNATFHTTISKPKRIDRQVAKLTLLGGLGAYDRTITKVTFSANSSILAVSDLAGYVDTFVLEGVEDLLQPASKSDSEGSSSESSDSESDSDSEVETKTKLIFGQHWTRNPSAPSLPKLPSAPVMLSFRPAAHKEDGEGLTNGAIPRSTRKTPNPVSHNIPDGEERLLVVTATSEIFEFEVLKGGLSQWSKQNPTSAFPGEFKKALEQVRGCIWDVKEGRERVWLYSIGWLWMFDLSQNFPPSTSEGTQSSKKRKRMGAGGDIANEQLETGMSRKALRVVHDEEIYEQQTLIDSDEMDIDDDEDTETRALTRLSGNEIVGEKVEEGGRAQHWHTYKYRPILGVVEIGEGDEQGPEVALVERPIWETDMPPRYYGDQEWKDQAIGIAKNSL